MTGLSPFWNVVIGAVVLVVCVTVAAVVVLSDDTYRAAPQPETVDEPRPAAAAATLHAFAEAVTTRDSNSAVGLAPSGDVAAAEQLRAAVENAADLDVADFTARYVDEVGATELDGSWTAVVDVTWRFAGFDGAPATAEVLVAFAPDGETAGIESFGGGDRRTPLWLRERLEVVRTSQALVMVAGSAEEAETQAERVRRAIPVVRRVLPRWRPSVVLEVPGSAAELDATLGADPGTYAGIAAVTASVDGSQAKDAPVHVFVNPEVTDRLQRRGAQVVMSHELVHVATDAAKSSVDPWLLEGFADYVALRNVRLPLSTTAGRALDQIRRDGMPQGLPGATEFDTRAEDLEAAYELAWLACLEVAEAAGENALVATYLAAEAGASTGAALRQQAGLSVAELESRWRNRLRKLTG